MTATTTTTETEKRNQRMNLNDADADFYVQLREVNNGRFSIENLKLYHELWRQSYSVPKKLEYDFEMAAANRRIMEVA